MQDKLNVQINNLLLRVFFTGVVEELELLEFGNSELLSLSVFLFFSCADNKESYKLPI